MFSQLKMDVYSVFYVNNVNLFHLFRDLKQLFLTSKRGSFSTKSKGDRTKPSYLNVNICICCFLWTNWRLKNGL